MYTKIAVPEKLDLFLDFFSGKIKNALGRYQSAVGWGNIIGPVKFRCQWLAPYKGTINQILRCDWLSEGAKWRYLALPGLPAVSLMEILLFLHKINPLSTKLVRSKWLDIGQVLFLGAYGARLYLGVLTLGSRIFYSCLKIVNKSVVSCPGLAY